MLAELHFTTVWKDLHVFHLQSISHLKEGAVFPCYGLEFALYFLVTSCVSFCRPFLFLLFFLPVLITGPSWTRPLNLCLHFGFVCQRWTPLVWTLISLLPTCVSLQMNKYLHWTCSACGVCFGVQPLFLVFQVQTFTSLSVICDWIDRALGPAKLNCQLSPRFSSSCSLFHLYGSWLSSSSL